MWNSQPSEKSQGGLTNRDEANNNAALATSLYGAINNNNNDKRRNIDPNHRRPVWLEGKRCASDGSEQANLDDTPKISHSNAHHHHHGESSGHSHHRSIEPYSSVKQYHRARTNSDIIETGAKHSNHNDNGDDDSDCNDDMSIASSLVSFRSIASSSIASLVNKSFILHGQPSSVRDGGNTATISNEIANLIKNLVGAGALGLPSGVAAFTGSPSALWPATIIIFIMGGIFGYYFLLMGRICKMTGTATYREAWECTVGDEGAWLVALFTTLMAGLGNLAYSMVLADTTQSLLTRATGYTWITRTQSLLGVTIFVLLPLCLVKKLTVLAPFSSVGLVGIVFTVIVMAIRYCDGTYDVGGKYLSDLPEGLQPSFNEVGATGAFSLNTLLLVCMTFQAYFAHYNAPRYFIELTDNTIPRFSVVVGSSFSVAAIVYAFMTAFGFLTFGANSNGFILNNYSTNDNLATLCRLAIAIALALTYPLPFIGTRDGVLDLLIVPTYKQTSSNLNVLTVVLLFIFTMLAMHFTNLGMVNAVGGGALGTAVVFVFPALMYSKAVQNLSLGVTPRTRTTERQVKEANFAICLMWLGIFIGAIGVLVALVM